MTEREWLIHNLYRKFEKDKWQLKMNLMQGFKEVALTTTKGKEKITMIIKIEDNE